MKKSKKRINNNKKSKKRIFKKQFGGNMESLKRDLKIS